MGRTVSTVMRGTVRPAEVEEHITRGKIASETGISRIWPMAKMAPRSASGRRGAEADDARVREVGRGHSSFEVGEQGGAIRYGAGGAKGRGQGECGPATHEPDAAPGNCVTGAGAHTLRRSHGPTFGPEVGAVCGKAACTDLCGGRGAILVPTATHRRGTRPACRSRSCRMGDDMAAATLGSTPHSTSWSSASSAMNEAT